MPEFETILYTTDRPVATVTLNRPEHLNTIVPPMPDEVEAAIGLADRDPSIKVIVLRGAGLAFCGGYDFGGGFQHWGESMMTDGRWDPGKDFAMVSGRATGPTRSHGHLAGDQAGDRSGARLVCGRRRDYALCADLVIASEDAVSARPTAECGVPTCPGCGCIGCLSARPSGIR